MSASSFVGLFFWLPGAFGGESPEPMHLRFDVERALANQCPPEARFMELLRAELPRLRLASEDASARTFDVRIRRGAANLHGEVVVTSTDGASYTRSVDAHDCATLMRILAVVAALASNALPDAPPVFVPPETNEDEKETEAPAPTPVRNTRGTRRKTSRAPTAKREVWMPGAGLGSELVSGSLPRSVIGYRVYADLARKLGQTALGGRLSLAYAGASIPGPARLDVRVQTFTARLEGCISRRVFPVVSIEGCVAATGGSFEASSPASAATTEHGDLDAAVDPWLSLGVGARARWHLGPSVYSELFGNVSIPTTRFDAVSKDSLSVVHFAVSQVVNEVGLGLGFYFGGR